jgi:hypothetical protein
MQQSLVKPDVKWTYQLCDPDKCEMSRDFLFGRLVQSQPSYCWMWISLSWDGYWKSDHENWTAGGWRYLVWQNAVLEHDFGAHHHDHMSALRSAGCTHSVLLLKWMRHLIKLWFQTTYLSLSIRNYNRTVANEMTMHVSLKTVVVWPSLPLHNLRSNVWKSIHFTVYTSTPKNKCTLTSCHLWVMWVK